MAWKKAKHRHEHQGAIYTFDLDYAHFEGGRWAFEISVPDLRYIKVVHQKELGNGYPAGTTLTFGPHQVTLEDADRFAILVEAAISLARRGPPK